MFGFDKLNQRSQRLKIFLHEVGILNLNIKARFDENHRAICKAAQLRPPKAAGQLFTADRFVLQQDVAAGCKEKMMTC